MFLRQWIRASTLCLSLPSISASSSSVRLGDKLSGGSGGGIKANDKMVELKIRQKISSRLLGFINNNF